MHGLVDTLLALHRDAPSFQLLRDVFPSLAEGIIPVKASSRSTLIKLGERTVIEIHGADAVILCQVNKLPNRSVVECGEDFAAGDRGGYGIGYAFADQVPHFQHPIVKSNIGTRCLFRLEDPAALDGLRLSLVLGQEQGNVIMNLPDRHMVVRRPDIPFPFLARIPDLF